MHFKILSAICFILDQSKILSSGNELISHVRETRKFVIAILQGNKGCNMINKSGKLSQDTPVLPEVVKLGHAPDKIQV